MRSVVCIKMSEVGEKVVYISSLNNGRMKKEFTQISVGIDIAKADFKACIMGRLTDKQSKIIASATFSNTVQGFASFWQWAERHRSKTGLTLECLMEATGIYHENLAWFLYEKKVTIVIVLPNQAKAFFKSEGIKSKNDTIDAQGLAKMSLSKSLRAWQPISPVLHRLRTQTRHHASLQKDLTKLGNQLHALEHSHLPDKLVKKQLKQNIDFLAKQLEETQTAIVKTIQTDEKLAKRIQYLTSIYGVGLLTAATVVAETNGFALFTSQAQLVSFAGYDVIEHQSGKYKGQTRISKKGNSHIRRILFMPAFNAVKKNGVLKELYQRVFEKTKSKMKAYVAVQRKLLCLMYTLWKKEEDFDPQIKSKKFVEEPEALLPEIVPV